MTNLIGGEFLVMAKGVVRFRLSEVLEEIGWTQIKLSLEAGISANSISNLVSDPRQVRFDTLASIIEATGVPLNELLVYEPLKTPETN